MVSLPTPLFMDRPNGWISANRPKDMTKSRVHLASRSSARYVRPRLVNHPLLAVHVCIRLGLGQEIDGRQRTSPLFLGKQQSQCLSHSFIIPTRPRPRHASRKHGVELVPDLRHAVQITLFAKATLFRRDSATHSYIITPRLACLRRNTERPKILLCHQKASRSDLAYNVGEGALHALREPAINVDYRKYGATSLSKRAVGPVRDVRGAAQNVPFTSHKESVVHHRRQHVNEVFGRMMHKSRVSMFIQVDDGVRCSRSVTPTRAFERGGEVAKSTVLTREKRLARGPPCLCGIRDGLSLDRFLIKDVHRIP